MTDKAKATGLDDIKRLIKTDGEYAIGALMQLYSRQTYDEQFRRSTELQNGVGFNGTDATFCSSLAEQYTSRGSLSPRQIQSLFKLLPKYAKQLYSMGGVRPLENKAYQKTVTQAYTEAGMSSLGESVNDSLSKLGVSGVQVGGTKLVVEAKSAPVLTSAPANGKVTLTGDTLRVSFAYNPVLVEKVKTLLNRRWNSGEKVWTAPFCDDNITKLTEWGFTFDKAVTDRVNGRKADTASASDMDFSVLKEKLFPFQEEGIRFIQSRRGRALVADSMGLGKTAQALGWLALNRAYPALVVVPASLKLNWRREIRKFVGPDVSVSIINGTSGENNWSADITIINYDILRAWEGKLITLKFKTLIADECHYAKNQKAQRTKTLRSIVKGIPHVLALSGTPIVNRPIEMYTAINMVDPNLFPSFWHYTKRYCGAKNNGWGWDFNGATNTQELYTKLTDSIMIRRLKEDVLKDLPAKIRTVLPIELENATEYRRAERDFMLWLREGEGPEAVMRASRAETLVRIEKLKQLAVKGKMDSAIEWIRNWVETDGKLVVFAVHQDVTDRLMEEFRGIAVRVDGRDSSQSRDKAVQDFQNNDNIRLFVGNLQAAGVGLTLTAASSTCFLELGWTPGGHDQAEDRVHRIGQTADSVNAYYLLSEGTIEVEIAKLLDTKRKVVSQILDGQDVADDSLLVALLNRYSEGE